LGRYPATAEPEPRAPVAYRIEESCLLRRRGDDSAPLLARTQIDVRPRAFVVRAATPSATCRPARASTPLARGAGVAR
jgi:hypothetical protein